MTSDEILQRLDVPQERLAEFCRKWRVAELSFFGSVTGGEFRPDSDVDVLISPAPDARWSLFEHVDMTDELRDLFRRPVDLLTRRSVESSRNWMRRESILQNIVTCRV